MEWPSDPLLLGGHSFPRAPFSSDFARPNNRNTGIRSRLVYELVRRRLCFIQRARRIVPIVKGVCQGVNHNAGFERACGRVGCASNSGSPNLRVTVVRTTAEATIAALRAAARLAAGLGAELVLLSAEEVPLQFALAEIPVPVELLERQLQGFVHASGIREREVAIQLLLCRDKYSSLPRALRPSSLVVIGESERWWSRGSRKLQQFLKGLGHQVVPVASPRSKCFRSDRDWEILLMHALVNFGSRRIEA